MGTQFIKRFRKEESGLVVDLYSVLDYSRLLRTKEAFQIGGGGSGKADQPLVR